MNLPKFPHSAMSWVAQHVARLNIYSNYLKLNIKNHFEFIVILCPIILDNKTYLSRKWTLDDKNVFIVCDVQGKSNEWIKLFKDMLKTCQTLFIIDDCSAEGEINKKTRCFIRTCFQQLT